MADYDTRALAGFSEEATPSDSAGPLITALSLSPKGVTPQRWIVDLAFHDIGLMPHVHVFYLNPDEGDPFGEPMNVCCQTCFKQYSIDITGGPCAGLLHHLHSMFESETVVAQCCHCGVSVNAVVEQPTIPQSLIYRMRKARLPVSTNRDAPQFHETIEVLIRILHTAATAGSDSINAESKMFRNKVGLDDSSKEFLKLAGFSFDEKRFHPPEYTPERAQFLNRCCFQLRLILWNEKPASLGVPLEPAYRFLLQRLGGATYKPDANEKVVQLSDKGSLLAERDSTLGKLGCLTDMGDDAVIDAFRTQVYHDITAAHPLVDLLVEVQKKRKSDNLDIEIVCQRSEGIVKTAELRSAYRDFEIPDSGEGISTDVLIGLIRASLHSGSKENLKIIAASRHDLNLDQLIDMPSEDNLMEDPTLDMYYAQNPVGLSNIGNTCYLNSLLQYFYTVKEIRETVLNMEAYTEDEDSEDWKGKVIDGRILSRQDVAEAKEIVTELRNLFLSMQSARSRSVTPSNRLVELLLSTGKDGLTEKRVPGGADQFFEQQDISEDVTMEELIDEYFDAEDGEPESSTSDGGGPKDGEGRTRPITITDLPSILQIHLTRTRFDRDDKTSYKSNASITIPKHLYLDQYLESNLEDHSNRIKRMRLWKGERRKRRRTLEAIKKQQKVA
ncbi:ubiquitin-specific protease ubp2 [Mortierella sp. GBA30]|nr:ubiquitin-specific protease ubp2 [Mortierella sp. GBA30]